MMKFFPRHMILSGRILAILFILANSGFTAVLRQCTMKSIAPMECCGGSDQSNESTCDGTQNQAGLRLVESQFSCHTTTLVGGIATTFALLQKELTKQNIKTNEMCGRYQQNTICTNTLYHSTNPAQVTATLSPPSVEKYVLNETFLI